MSGLAVKTDLTAAVRAAQADFERFAVDRFPRALQFALTGVATDAVNMFRREIPNVWHAPKQATRDALRYVVDKDLLARVASVGEAKAEVFLQDFASTWLKFSFGEGKQTRLPGDVGVEVQPARPLLRGLRVRRRPHGDSPPNAARTTPSRTGCGPKLTARSSRDRSAGTARGLDYRRRPRASKWSTTSGSDSSRGRQLGTASSNCRMVITLSCAVACTVYSSTSSSNQTPGG